MCSQRHPGWAAVRRTDELGGRKGPDWKFSRDESSRPERTKPRTAGRGEETRKKRNQPPKRGNSRLQGEGGKWRGTTTARRRRETEHHLPARANGEGGDKKSKKCGWEWRFFVYVRPGCEKKTELRRAKAIHFTKSSPMANQSVLGDCSNTPSKFTRRARRNSPLGGVRGGAGCGYHTTHFCLRVALQRRQLSRCKVKWK